MKKLLLFTLLFLLPAAVYGQAGHNRDVLLTINSTDGLFRSGDTVIVKASLQREGTSDYVVRLIEGGSPLYCEVAGLAIPEKKVSLSKEPLEIYREVCQGPCQRVISVVPTDKSKKKYNVGFLVDPQDFKPGYEMPSDFSEYWEAQKAAMRKTKMKVKKAPLAIPDAEDAAKYVAYDIEISMNEGNPARGYLVMPRNAKKKSLPINIYLHGAGVNRPGHRSTLKTALSMAKMGGGCIGFDLNAHGMLNDQSQDYYDSLAKGELKSYNSRPLTTREDFYYRLMFLRELRALDFLCGLKEWDGKRVLAQGTSQGGGQALVLGCLDERVGAVVATVPNMCDFGGISQGHLIAGPRYYAKVSTTDFGKSILNYFDACHFIRQYRGKLFIITGAIDDICNAAGIHAVFNLCPSAEKEIYDSPFRWHSGTNAPYNKQWNSTVAARRDRFFEDYLKR